MMQKFLHRIFNNITIAAAPSLYNSPVIILKFNVIFEELAHHSFFLFLFPLAKKKNNKKNKT